jgi:hypothetical protein
MRSQATLFLGYFPPILFLVIDSTLPKSGFGLVLGVGAD